MEVCALWGECDHAAAIPSRGAEDDFAPEGNASSRGLETADVYSAVMLDRLGLAVILVDADCRVLMANTASRQFAALQTPLSLGRKGMEAANNGSGRQLSNLVTRCLETRAPQGIVLVSTADGPKLWVLGSPVQLNSINVQSSFGQAVMLQIISLCAARTPDLTAVRDVFGLTKAEARVLLGLIEGQTVEECASSRGVSISTIRSQVSALLAKTGTRRQAELVSIVARMVSFATPAVNLTAAN